MGLLNQDFKKHDGDNEDDIDEDLTIETEFEADDELSRIFSPFSNDNNDDDDDDDDDNDDDDEEEDEDDDDDDYDDDDDDEEDNCIDSDSDSSFSVITNQSSSAEENEDGNESDTSSIKSLGAGREMDEEDDLIKKIKKAKNVKKQQPPNIVNGDIVTSISFSPSQDIIAVGTMDGDIFLHSYDLESTQVILKYSAHNGSCRKIEYDENGELLYTISDDRVVIVADANTGSFKYVYENAHTKPIYTLSIINKNLFCTGDDEGIVKLWDHRKKEEIFSQKIGTEYVSSLQCVEGSSTLACTAGDGCVTGINMNTRRVIDKSTPYIAEITCSGLFSSNTKIAMGTSVGSLLLYNWGQFSSWNDEFPALDKKKHAINCMIPITENVVITGLDNGLIRATHLFPMRHIGIVGTHGTTIEGLDINRDGTLLASSSIDKKICFWNVEYFEDVQLTDKDKKDNDKAKEHNLPSSLGINASDFFSGLA